MDPALTDVLPDDVSPGTVASWSSVIAIPLIAGIVQVLVRSGLPVKHVSLACLLLGIAGGLASAISTDLSMFTGLIQGSAIGLGAFGAYAQFSPNINTNGE